MATVFEEGENLIIIGTIAERFVHRSRIGPWQEAVIIPKAALEEIETISPASPDHLAPYRIAVERDII